MLIDINYATSSQLATISAPKLDPPAPHELIAAPSRSPSPARTLLSRISIFPMAPRDWLFGRRRRTLCPRILSSYQLSHTIHLERLQWIRTG